MKLTLAFLIALTAVPAMAEPRTVKVPEVPDPFMPIPLTKVSWGENTAEGDAARELCGGPIKFVGWERDEANRLIHVAECL